MERFSYHVLILIARPTYDLYKYNIYMHIYLYQICVLTFLHILYMHNKYKIITYHLCLTTLL